MTVEQTYSSEYAAASEAVGVLDRSERGKLALAGADAKSCLQGQVSNDVEGLASGQGCYAAFLTPKGKMLGDIRILDTGSELLLDTERVALQGLFNMLRRAVIGYDAELRKRTLECGLLSLIGPASDSILAPAPVPSREHAHVPVQLAGRPARAIRTDLGIDLLCDAADTEALLEAAVSLGAVVVSEPVADCLRIERGRPRYGVELDDTVIPQEAGLNERAVSFTKGCYVGQETVARLYYRGKPNRSLRGLRCDATVQVGAPLSFEGRTVGAVASFTESPRIGPIALAFVRREAPPGSRVSVGESGGAEVVELPFTTD